jgi:hypothetical protein
LLEGALTLSKLYQDSVHMERAVEYLTRYIEVELRKRDTSIHSSTITSKNDTDKNAPF